MVPISVLIFFIACSQILCQESPVPITENPVPLNNETLPSYYDYILHFSFELNEVQVPSYVVDLIYNESTNSITTDDVLDLYKVKRLNLTETQTVLDKMNISEAKILSIDGFDVFLTELEVNFKDIYDKVTSRLNLSGAALREFLTDLGINADAFSSALAFGFGDPYEEFKKGNFSKDSVEPALTKVSKTLDELFTAVRDEFVPWANSKQRTVIVQKLNKYNFGKRSAVNLWSVLNLTLENVRQIPDFNTTISNAAGKWNNSKVVGILTGPYEAIVNLVGYETWKDDPLVKVSAESYSNKTKVQVRWVVVQSELPNIIKLSCANMNITSESITYAVTGTSTESTLSNCTFITANNVTLLSEVIFESHNHENEIHTTNFTSPNEIVIGSPLICQNSVYGLAKSVSNNTITFDTFHVGHSGHGSASSTSFNNFLYPVFLTVLFCYLFWLG